MSVTKERFISEYLERINYRGPVSPCLDTLLELQQHHVHHILFENLDLLGDSFVPNLDRDYLFDKIVTRRRGGVCYELNTSFYNLLTAMGFSAHQISGCVQPGENMFSHVATLVHLKDSDYIADVGLGDGYLPVLKINESPCAQYAGCEYDLVPLSEDAYNIMCRQPSEEDKRIYTISLVPRTMEDYFGRFRWASAKGNTVFSQRPICVSHTPEQRITLRRDTLTVERSGKIVESFSVTSQAETKRVLREYFNLL